MLACRLPNPAPGYQASTCVRALLTAKADPARASDKYRLTALHVAAESAPPQCPTQPCAAALLTAPAPLGRTAGGYIAVVQQLVEVLEPKEVDHTLEDGKTALILACKIGHPRTVKVLLEAKADPLLKDHRNRGADGFTPIMHAALFGNVECVATVLRNARQDLRLDLIKAHNDTADTALHLAALHGHRRVVALLLRERAEVGLANQRGETPLHMSSKNGHAQVVCALLASGANVNKADTVMGYTALHHCCTASGGKDVADALMEVGAKVNLRDQNQNTPLHLACVTGNDLIVDTLLEYKVRACGQGGRRECAVRAVPGHFTAVLIYDHFRQTPPFYSIHSQQMASQAVSSAEPSFC